MLDEAKTEYALSRMSAFAQEEVSAALQILRESESLQEAKSYYLDDMAIDGSSFSIVVKRNFQFVIAGVLGEDQNGTLIVEVKSYE